MNAPARFRNSARQKTILFLTAFIFIIAVPTTVWGKPNPATSITSRDGVRVFIPGKNVGPKATFFSFRTKQNILVRFFAIRDNQKKVHVAFDACDVCFQAKKGYRIIRGFAICNNCGQRFPLAAIGTDNLRGGCWPSYLPIKVAGNHVEILVKNIEKKAFLFQ
jgi:uncharacterized membrane protein